MKRILLLSLISGSAFLGKSQVVINEVCAANLDNYVLNGTAFYGGDNYHDWIELYNTSGSVVDISGWHLSDRIDNPTKFVIPAGTTIPANGRRIFICSGFAGDDPLGDFAPNAFGQVNTNFRITQAENEYAVLANPAGDVIDSYQIVLNNQANHSWGRMPEGTGPFRIMTTPTPNAANSAQVYVSYAATPQFNQTPGYHGAPISVTITSPQPGVEIRYTTDGLNPTTGSTLYTGPINLNVTTVLRARAFHSDPQILSSFIETATYFFGNDQHTLPVASICGNNLSQLFGGSQINPIGVLEYFDEDGVRVSVNTGEYNKHGNDSWAYEQRGVDYIVKDQTGYGDAINYQIFKDTDRESFQRIMFKAAANDNYPFSNGAHIRDAYVQQLSWMGDLKLDVRHNQACIVYLNGQYWGVYEVRSKADDPDYTSYYHGQDRAYLYFLKTWGGTWTEYGAPNAQPTWNALVAQINGYPTPLSDPNYLTVEAELSTKSLIDYFILNSYVVCADWLNWNTAWWKGRDPNGDHKKWGYTLWDMDNTFGHGTNYTGVPTQQPTADPCNPEVLGNPGGQGHVPILNKLMTNDLFVADYINRYADLSNTYFSCDYMVFLLDSMTGAIDPEMPRQIQKWGGNYNTWVQRVNTMRDWILARCSDEIIGGIEDCYDVVAQDLIVEIDGEGNVQVSTVTLTPADVPWSGTYFSPIIINIEAIETTGLFIGWEVLDGDIVIADPTALVTTMTMNTGGTIIAHFITELQATIEQTMTLCHDSCDGSATITSLGGTEPYTYTWDGVPGDATIATLCPGPHTAVASDADGTIVEFNFTIEAPEELSIVPTVEQITCNGLTDGQISVSTSGGTAPYFFTLDPLGSTNQTGSFTDLFEGGYDLLAQDDNGCSTSFAFDIIEPDGMTITVVNIVNLACGGLCNGTVTLNVFGGTPQYTFEWNGSDQTGTNDLCAGNNNVVVTDAQGCFVSQEVIIEEPQPLQLVIISTNATCVGMDNGTAIVTAIGGTPPLAVDLGPEMTEENLTALPFGTYPIVVTDALNCTDEGEIIIGYDVISDLEISVFTTPVSCWNQQDGTATAVIQGGVEPVSVEWNDSKNQKTHIAVGLSEETYVVTVTDDLGCNISAEAEVEVNEGCFFIASVLTPNGDGANDFWTVGGLEHFPRSSVQVFDRWGQLLFESKQYPNPWDGTFNGKKLPLADYYYVITYDPAKDPLTGTVSIKY